MPVVKQCASCDKPFTCNRSHALTCGSTCRGIQWRANKTPMIPVKIAFSTTHFAAIENAADASDVSINKYLHDRIIQIMECSQ